MEIKSKSFSSLDFFSANPNGAANKVQGNNASGKKKPGIKSQGKKSQRKIVFCTHTENSSDLKKIVF